MTIVSALNPYREGVLSQEVSVSGGDFRIRHGVIAPYSEGERKTPRPTRLEVIRYYYTNLFPHSFPFSLMGDKQL